MTVSELREYCDYLLIEGNQRLSMPMGVVSHIENFQYVIFAIKSSADLFVLGESFALDDTYCRDVYRSGKTLALTEFDGQPGLQRHPLYENLPLEAYISTPIIHNEIIWGTLNFTSMKIREQPFSIHDIDYVVSLADKVSVKLKELSNA